MDVKIINMKKPIWAAVICISLFVCANNSSAGEHYLDRYKSVVIYPMDQSPDAENLSDSKARFKAEVFNAEKGGMPKLEKGAKDFLGNAWSFKDVTSCFTSKTGEGIFTLGDINKTKRHFSLFLDEV
jgi:hypothetical protein